MNILKRKWEDFHLFLYLKYKPVLHYKEVIKQLYPFIKSQCIKLTSHSVILPVSNISYLKGLYKDHFIPEASPIIPFTEIVTIECGPKTNLSDPFLIIITRDFKVYFLPGQAYNFLCYRLSYKDIKEPFCKTYIWWLIYHIKNISLLLKKKEISLIEE